MSVELLLFFIFAAGACLGGLGVVFFRDPIKGAMALIGSFFSLACLYLLQKAELIAVLEVMVYAGAIMVLFVFVIMLVENHDEPIVPRHVLRRVMAGLKFLAIAVVTVCLGLIVVVRTTFDRGPKLAEDFGTAKALGREFMTGFIFQFELASVLLLIAIVGAVMISRKNP